MIYWTQVITLNHTHKTQPISQYSGYLIFHVKQAHHNHTPVTTKDNFAHQVMLLSCHRYQVVCSRSHLILPEKTDRRWSQTMQ